MVTDEQVEKAWTAYEVVMARRGDDPKHPAMDGVYWPRLAIRAALESVIPDEK